MVYAGDVIDDPEDRVYDHACFGFGELRTFGEEELFPWVAAVNTDKAGDQILGVDKLPLLHAKVMADCDAIDGLQDGLLDDPRECAFDPGSIRCADGAQQDCLTGAQVDVVRKLYQGPVDDQGRRLFPSGWPRGSELGWFGSSWPRPAASRHW